MANFKLKESADKTSSGTVLAGVNIIPQTGFIMPFAGTTAPSGWALCDGTGGTPDLRGHFLIGATSSANIGAVKGASSHTHSYAFSAVSVDNSSNAADHGAPLSGNLDAGGVNNTAHSHTYTASVDTPSYYSGNFINWSNGSNTTRTFRSHDHVGSTNTMTTGTGVVGNHVHNRTAGAVSNGTITETSHKHNVSSSPSGTTTSGETIPGNIIMNYIVKL